MYRTLKAAELHCYYANHKQEVLDLIAQSERETLAGLTEDFNKEVRKEVANIQEKERRERLVREHREAKQREQSAKDKLPFLH